MHSKGTSCHTARRLLQLHTLLCPSDKKWQQGRSSARSAGPVSTALPPSLEAGPARPRTCTGMRPSGSPSAACRKMEATSPMLEEIM